MEGVCSERSKTARHPSVGLFISGLVYVGQGEMAVGVSDDKNVSFFGSEDATTCHIIILRQETRISGKITLIILTLLL